jgi:hypothetical protein
MSRDMATVHCRMVASSATTTGDCDVLFIFTALHLTPSSLHDLLQSHSLLAATLCDNTAAKH